MRCKNEAGREVGWNAAEKADDNAHAARGDGRYPSPALALAAVASSTSSHCTGYNHESAVCSHVFGNSSSSSSIRAVKLGQCAQQQQPADLLQSPQENRLAEPSLFLSPVQQRRLQQCCVPVPVLMHPGMPTLDVNAK